MERPVTMQALADALGVGKATVSRAFRNHPKCGPELRARILAKAEEMGYTPDPIQRVHMAQVRRGRPENAPGMVIGMLEMAPGEYSIANLLSSRRFFEGARQRAKELGVGFELFNPLKTGLSLERFRHMLAARGIHGLIIAPVGLEHRRLPLKLDGIASVAIAYSMESPRLHRVGHHHYQAMWDVMEALRQKGLRRVGIAIEEDILKRVGRRWTAAYFEYARVYPEMVALEPFPFSETRRNVGPGPPFYRRIFRWAKAERLDALLGLEAWTDEMELVAREVGAEALLYVDIDVFPGKGNGRCAGVNQRFEAIAATALDEVVGQWSRSEYGVPASPKDILLSGKLVGF